MFRIAEAHFELANKFQVVVPNGKKESDYPRGDEQVTGEGRRIGSQGRHSSRWQERFLDDHEVPWQNFTSFPKQKGKTINRNQKFQNLITEVTDEVENHGVQDNFGSPN